MLNSALVDDASSDPSSSVKVHIFYDDKDYGIRRIESVKPPELASLSDAVYNTIAQPITSDLRALKLRTIFVTLLCFTPSIVILLVGPSWLDSTILSPLTILLVMVLGPGVVVLAWLMYHQTYVYGPRFQTLVEAHAPLAAKEGYHVTYETNHLCHVFPRSYLLFTKQEDASPSSASAAAAAVGGATV